MANLIATRPPYRWRQLTILLLILIAARSLFIALMPATYSTDLHSWLRVMGDLEAKGNPYRDLDVLNWPPFWMQILFGLHHISKHTGISPTLLIQATLVFGEILVLCVAFCIARRFFPNRSPFLPLLVGLALNPVAIFLSCQHCNYDVFVGLFVLLAVWMLMEWVSRGAPEAWLAACFFLGMGILSKTVPVMLTPLLLLHFRRLPLSTKAFGAVLVAAPFAIGMSVLFSLEPHGVMRNVIAYRSMAGWYGIGGLLLRAGWLKALFAYSDFSPFLFLGLMAFMTFWCYRQRALALKTVLMVALLLMMFIPTFGPGYSPPYILWFLPMLVLLFIAENRMRMLLIAGFAVMAVTYTTEYSLFLSHGAFLHFWYPAGALNALSDQVGSRGGQTLVRLPMFLFYLTLFPMLIRSIKNEYRASFSETVAAQATSN